MDLWIIVIILLACAIILLAASFFVKDNTADSIMSQVTDFTIPLVEELSAVKKRLDSLEKAAGKDSIPVSEPQIKKIDDLTKRQIITLFQRSMTFDEISEQLNLPETTVQLIVDNHVEKQR